MEGMTVVNITQDAAIKFLHNIIFRFGVPKWVLIDNGTQLKGTKFTSCCADFGFNNQASSAAHPQMNGQVGRAKGHILQVMKTGMFHDLKTKGRNWHKELPSILWAQCTNANRDRRDTLLHLVYWTDAVLPPKIFLELAQVAQ
jgi:transposase InsO family protein